MCQGRAHYILVQMQGCKESRNLGGLLSFGDGLFFGIIPAFTCQYMGYTGAFSML